MHVTQRDDSAAPVATEDMIQTEKTSRLMVRNIPKYVDEVKLREFFGSQGEITDSKVMRTRCEHSI